MSISNRHTVLPFTAGVSKAITTPEGIQRLSRVGYKSTPKNPAKYPSVCASIPPVSDTDILDNVEALIPYIRNMIESAQDGIFRSLYESSDGTLKEIGDSDISIGQVIAYLEAESTGSRLTGEVVGKWFDSQVSDNLTIVVCTKLGTEDTEDKKVKAYLKTYKELMVMLAGGKTVLTPQQRNGIRQALEVSSVDDEIGKKLVARLDAQDKKPVMSELLDLI